MQEEGGRGNGRLKKERGAGPASVQWSRACRLCWVGFGHREAVLGPWGWQPLTGGLASGPAREDISPSPPRPSSAGKLPQEEGSREVLGIFKMCETSPRFMPVGKQGGLGEVKVHNSKGSKGHRLPENKDPMAPRAGRCSEPGGGGAGGCFSAKAAEGGKVADKLIGL